MYGQRTWACSYGCVSANNAELWETRPIEKGHQAKKVATHLLPAGLHLICQHNLHVIRITWLMVVSTFPFSDCVTAVQTAVFNVSESMNVCIWRPIVYYTHQLCVCGYAEWTSEWYSCVSCTLTPWLVIPCNCKYSSINFRDVSEENGQFR